MNIFIEEHQEILKFLLKHQVEFMLIGGYAVIYYGYQRTTGDLDLWLKPDNENKLKLVNALVDAGFESTDLAQLSLLDFTKHIVFSIGMEPQKIDFITRINLVEYTIAEEHKILASIDDIILPIIHLNDLVLSKMNTGRKKDAADIEELQRLIQYKNQENQ